MATFPLEIFESIIDSVATKDNVSFATIKSCALVSRSFLPRARTHIFRSIPINNWDYPGATALTFERLISQTPEIAYYVRALDYGVEEQDWAIEGFISALRSLTHLQSLTIRPYHTPWGELPLRETILSLMCLPTLRHLKLEYAFDFPLSDLTLCVGLQFLELDHIVVQVADRDIETHQEQLPRLESYVEWGVRKYGLLMQLCTARRADGKPIVDISGLKKVAVGIQDGPHDETTELFKRCTQLTDARIDRTYSWVFAHKRPCS